MKAEELEKVESFIDQSSMIEGAKERLKNNNVAKYMMKQYADQVSQQAVIEALEKCCGMTKEQAIHALKHMNKPKYEPNK